jgi:quercetin dioxygenase-like cupin family protein
LYNLTQRLYYRSPEHLANQARDCYGLFIAGRVNMPAMEKKSLNQPEETNTPEKLKMEAVTLRGLTLRRVTTEPGWQWSKHLKPIQKTNSCQKDHILYIISGRLGVRMDDGKEEVFGPGDVGSIPPGHDGWTIGNQPLVWLEISH